MINVTTNIGIENRRIIMLYKKSVIPISIGPCRNITANKKVQKKDKTGVTAKLIGRANTLHSLGLNLKNTKMPIKAKKYIGKYVTVKENMLSTYATPSVITYPVP
jgi:hypothetical protein